jgi:flavin reductase (DIM6/NTAB) family NADH-FMN oxidoreductase RutF
MEAVFESQDLDTISDNVFQLIAQDWMLVTAGPLAHFNTMTANWGGLGYLWNRKVSYIFVRPHRYTFQFMEEYDAFSLAFFAERYRAALELCGTRSGREMDKVAACGLTPVELTPGITSFAEARLILECKKIYAQDILPEKFIEPTIAKQYPTRDYHRMYIGEITGGWHHKEEK